MKEELEEKNGGPELLDITVMMNDFFRILRKNWFLIVMLVAVTAAGFGLYRRQSYSPTYTASSTYVVTTSLGSTSGNYYDTALARQISETFPYILTSQVLQRRVAQELGVDDVPGEIQASAMEGTNLLTISVTDSDPQRAAKTLQAVMETAPEISESIIGKVFLELMDETGIPTHPNQSMSLKADLIQGSMIGLLVSLVVILLVIILLI